MNPAEYFTEIFKSVDEEETGKVAVVELKEELEYLRVPEEFIERLSKPVEAAKEGKLEVDDFKLLMLDASEASIELLMFLKLCREIDKENKGTINQSELMRAIKLSGIKHEELQAQRIMNELGDIERDVEYEEPEAQKVFIQFLTSWPKIL
ncbi:mitochondrial adenyl nucleotide antiporter SLC25A24-like [Watersipora subatra]|uniref:mitochondrial adenyl nucleotide antiporter SLC25A24-like n=1 Tax=Watersipora subatra TaxID=2589382 RepID=UPI00355AD201